MTIAVEDQLRHYFAEVERDQEPIDVSRFTSSRSLVAELGQPESVLVLDDATESEQLNAVPEIDALEQPHDEDESTTTKRSALMLAAAASIAVIAGLILLLSRPDDSTPVITDQPALEALTIASAFIDARDRWDDEALLALVAADAAVAGDPPGTTVADYPATMAFERAAGFRFRDAECSTDDATDPFVVSCAYILENAWSRALGTGPFDGNTYRFVVEAGQIQEVLGGGSFARFTSDAWRPFRAWLRENHPDDHDVMYDSPSGMFARTTPDAVLLWEERTNEFVASLSGGAESTDVRAGETFPPGSWLYDVASTDRLLVAVGTDGAFCCETGVDGDAMPESSAAVWTSTDGVEWFRVPHDESVFGGPGGQAMFAVTATPDGFVAGGIDAGQTQSDAAIWISSDGQTWQRVPDPDAALGGDGQQRIKTLAYSAAGLVAIGFQEQYAQQGLQDTGIWTSNDGSEWTLIGPGPGPDTDAVVVGRPSGFVAFGPDVWESADGSTWTPRAAEASVPFGVESVIADGDGFVAIEQPNTPDFPADQRVWSSDDGQVWVRDDVVSYLEGAPSRVESFTPFDDGFVGVGLGVQGADYSALAGPIVTTEVVDQ